jgi:hypothetical protein
MSLLHLELRQNQATGRHDLIVKLDSDEDHTSHEHETLHKKLIAQLVGSGVFSADQLGTLVVERVNPAGSQTSQGQPTDTTRRAQTESQG